MRVYDTPNGRFLCDMDLIPQKAMDDFYIYTINDLSTIIEIIRSGCGDQFANDFGKLLQDFNDFTEETLCDAVCYQTENQVESDIDYDYEAMENRLESAEGKLSKINKLCKSSAGLLAILSFGRKDKFAEILRDLKEIERLSSDK